MRVTGPDFIALQVGDLQRSAAFYESHLGLRRSPGGPPHAVVFETAPITFAVREPLPGVVPGAARPRAGAGVVLWLHVDDVRRAHEELLTAGVEIVAAPTPSPFGLQLTFGDPDGYAVTLHERA